MKIRKVNKMKKKQIVFPLLLCLTLSSCGAQIVSSSASEKDPLTLNIWATSKEQEVIDEVVASYNNTHTDQIAINFTHVTESDIYKEISKDPKGNEAPDLFLTTDDVLIELKKDNIAYNVEKQYGQIVKANNYEAAVSAATINNELYGFPLSCDNGYFLWYNPKFLSEDDVTSIESILAKAKELGKKINVSYSAWYLPMYFMSPQVCGLDSISYHEEDGSIVYDISWDNEKGVAAASYITNIYKEYKGNYEFISTGEKGAWENETVIASITGTWMEQVYLEVVPNIKATVLPKFNGDKQMACFTGSKIYCINEAKLKDDKEGKLEKSLVLADLLTNKEGQLVRFEKRNTPPCNKEALKDKRYSENVSIGLNALVRQCELASAIQSRAIERKFYDVGQVISGAIYNNDIGQFADWSSFLNYQCSLLRGEGTLEQ